MIGLCIRGLLFVGLAVALGGLGETGVGFRGPIEALVALAGAAMLAFGLPTAVGGRRPVADPPSAWPDGVPAESGGEWPHRLTTSGSRRAALAAVGVSVGAWLPFAALWSRSYPSASALWLYVAAVAIGATAALCTVTGRRGVGSAAGAALFLMWMGALGLVIPGQPRWLAGGAAEAAAGARGAWEIVEAELELAGPLRSASVAYDGYPPLVIEADLLPGESKSLRAWIVAPRDRSFAAHERPDLVDADPVNLGGVAVRLADPPNASEPGAGPLDESSPLLQRALPEVGAMVVRLPLSARLAAVATALFLALAVIRYGARGAFAPLALAVGMGAAAFCQSGPTSEPREAPTTDGAVLLEGVRPDDGGRHGPDAGTSGRAAWALVQRCASPLVERLAEGGGTPVGRIRLGDLRGPLRTRVVALGPGPATRSVEARESGGPIDVVTSPFEPGLRLLMREVNTLGAFEAAWIRGPDGQWSGGGGWKVGGALVAEESMGGVDPAPGEPPPWARTGLPMGVSVFVGRLEPGAADALGLLPGSWTRRGAAGPHGTTSWVRLVGF